MSKMMNDVPLENDQNHVNELFGGKEDIDNANKYAFGMKQALTIIDYDIPLEVNIMRSADKGLYNVFMYNPVAHSHSSDVTTARELKKRFTKEMIEVFDEFFAVDLEIEAEYRHE